MISSIEQLIEEVKRRVSIIQSEPQTMARELMIENLSVGLDKYEEIHKEEMKKQHSDTWDSALDTYEKRGHVYIRAWEDFDEYFKETYNYKK